MGPTLTQKVDQFSPGRSLYDNDSKYEDSTEHYEAMVAAAKDGNCSEARKSLDRARLAEPRRIKEDVDQINLILEQVAEETKAVLIDAQSLLSNRGENYVDPVHPSQKGHLLIAEEMTNLSKDP